MTDPKPGNVVDIAIKAVLIEELHPPGCISVTAADSDGEPTLWVLPPQSIVTLVHREDEEADR